MKALTDIKVLRREPVEDMLLVCGERGQAVYAAAIYREDTMEKVLVRGKKVQLLGSRLVRGQTVNCLGLTDPQNFSSLVRAASILNRAILSIVLDEEERRSSVKTRPRSAKTGERKR